MINNDNTYKIQTRLNTIEYSDLMKDISQYEGASRGARIRYLLSAGLQATNAEQARRTFIEQAQIQNNVHSCASIKTVLRGSSPFVTRQDNPGDFY